MSYRSAAIAGCTRMARRISPILAGLALNVVSRAAQTPSAAASPAPPRTGTIVLLGEPFVLPSEVSSELLAISRPGECVWITPSGTASDATDPLRDSCAEVARLELDPNAEQAADDGALCERVRRAGSIALTHGSYLDWYSLLRPSEKPSGLCAALLEARRSGALLVASGAAASFLSDWAAVDRAAFHRLQRNPRNDREHTLAQGLGLLRGLSVDASGAPLGGWSRWLTLAARSSGDLALYLHGPVAWILRGDRDGDAIVRGSGAAFVLDLEHASRSRGSLLGARLSLLLDRDRWSSRERSVLTAARPLEPNAADSAREIPPSTTAPDAETVRFELTREFGPARATVSTFATPDLELTLRFDARTRFGPSAADKSGAADDKSGARARIALDLHWGDRAER
jgi:hypothetical protein